MNERLRKLAKQAGLEMCGCGCDMPTRQSAKFVDLIVREAAQFVSGSAEVYTQAEQDACVRAARGLKKYFGVEE